MKRKLVLEEALDIRVFPFISDLFLKLIYFFIEGYLLYRILLFSVKLQHESAIGIYISLPFETPSHLPPHPTPLG